MKQITKYIKSNKGLSLMELLISMAILAILAVCFASIFLPAIRLEGNAVVLNHGTADMATLLEETMEEGTAALPGGVTVVPGKEITITFPGHPDIIIGTGEVVQTEDADTGAKLETYVNSAP